MLVKHLTMNSGTTLMTSHNTEGLGSPSVQGTNIQPLPDHRQVAKRTLSHGTTQYGPVNRCADVSSFRLGVVGGNACPRYQRTVADGWMVLAIVRRTLLTFHRICHSPALKSFVADCVVCCLLFVVCCLLSVVCCLLSAPPLLTDKNVTRQH
jgi:hypothetical protein